MMGNIFFIVHGAIVFHISKGCFNLFDRSADW
jgi:hypothetical protein